VGWDGACLEGAREALGATPGSGGGRLVGMPIWNVPTTAVQRLLGCSLPAPMLPERSASEWGVSPTPEEYVVLATLLRASNPKNVFEFGTAIGGSTRVLALNAPQATVYTLDLEEPRTDQKVASEAHLSVLGSNSRGALAQGLPNVVFLRGDSRKYDFSGVPPCDFIFIDGGHDDETLHADTESAFRLLNPANPSAVIAWHDCSNWALLNVNAYTKALSVNRRIFGALNTMLRFYVPRLEGVESDLLSRED